VRSAGLSGFTERIMSMTELALRADASVTLAPERKGLLFGLGAVLIWGSYLALARQGVSNGLTGADFTLIRYGTAGLVMLPWLLRHDPLGLAGVGWIKGFALAALAGPLFILAGVGGYAYAPLAHGAVVQPATIVIATTVLAVLFFRDKPDRARLIGIGIMIAGLAAIAGPSLFTGSGTTLLGDALFATAGLLWAGFTIVTRRWGMKALPATAAVSVVSMVIAVPAHLGFLDLSRITALPIETLLVQILVQGVFSGVVAVIFFTRAAELLGPSRAAIFPALVPAAAILIGIPVVGEWPTALQAAGLGLVSIGLLSAVGVLRGITLGRS
jgi:drug/metabolite transporter (DMT)-like permease